MHAKFWSQNMKARDYLEYLHIDGRIILEWNLQIQGGKL
jgi:hypothetical protein